MTRLYLENLRQPWVFAVYAVAFGGLTYGLQHITVARAVFGGVAFALLMSGWRELRRRRLQNEAGG